MEPQVKFTNHSDIPLYLTPDGGTTITLPQNGRPQQFAQTNNYRLQAEENKPEENYLYFKWGRKCSADVEITGVQLPPQQSELTFSNHLTQDITVRDPIGNLRTVKSKDSIPVRMGGTYTVEQNSWTIMKVDFRFRRSVNVTVSHSVPPPPPTLSRMIVANGTLQDITIRQSRNLHIPPGDFHVFEATGPYTLAQGVKSIPVHFRTGTVDVFITVGNPFHDAKITIKNSYSKTVYVAGSSPISPGGVVAESLHKEYQLSTPTPDADSFLDVNFDQSFSVWVNIAQPGSPPPPPPPPPEKPRITILNAWGSPLEVTPPESKTPTTLDLGRFVLFAEAGTYTLVDDSGHRLQIDYERVFDVFAVVEDTSPPMIRIENNYSKDGIDVKFNGKLEATVSPGNPFSSGTAGSYGVFSNSFCFLAVEFPEGPYSIGFNILDRPGPPPPPPSSGMFLIENGTSDQTLIIHTPPGTPDPPNPGPGSASGPFKQPGKYLIDGATSQICECQFFGTFGVDLLVQNVADPTATVKNNSNQPITVNSKELKKGDEPLVIKCKDVCGVHIAAGSDEIAMVYVTSKNPVEITINNPKSH